MNTDQREAKQVLFEAWVRQRGGSCVKRDGGYVESMTRLWWECWLASATASHAKIADLEQRIEHLTESANGAINEAIRVTATASEGRIAEQGYEIVQLREVVEMYQHKYAAASSGLLDARAALAGSATPSATAQDIFPDWPACNPACEYEDPHGSVHDCRSATCSCEAAKASITRQRAAAKGGA